MKISAVKLYDKGYMLQPFAFGGEDGPEAFDPAVRYRSSLQNYVIDTGDEVILVDTGMPKEVPQAVPDASTPIFMGIKGDDYVDALKKLGYEPEQISKILITHKHADHTGELRNFPNAKIYASVEECETEELLHYPNLVPVAFCIPRGREDRRGRLVCPGERPYRRQQHRHCRRRGAVLYDPRRRDLYRRGPV